MQFFAYSIRARPELCVRRRSAMSQTCAFQLETTGKRGNALDGFRIYKQVNAGSFWIETESPVPHRQSARDLRRDFKLAEESARCLSKRRNNVLISKKRARREHRRRTMTAQK